MPKRKKRTVSGTPKKRKDDSPDNVSEGDSLERPPSAKKVAATSSTSQLGEEADQISSFTSVSLLNSTKVDTGEMMGSSHFWCNYCEFSADDKKELVTHMRQHMIKCSDCPFSSLSRNEVVRHCKYEHDKDFESASQEVDSSSTDCEMDKDPCSACVFCNFMTYSTEHLEKHTAVKHPGLLAKSVAKMISKHASAEVRKDDAVFYQSVTGPGSSTKMNVPAEPSGPIVIDKPEDIKPEVKPQIESKPSVSSDPKEEQLLNSIKCQLAADIFADMNKAEKMTNKETPERNKSDSTKAHRHVKVETMYCLTCPYSNVYTEKVKCHTFVQHPVGAAVATYNSSGESSSVDELTFFCIREDCSHSTADCSSFQQHLMTCCSSSGALKVLQKERLKSTITYILDLLKKLNQKAIDGFFAYVSPFLGSSLSIYETSHHSTATQNQNFEPKSENSLKNRTADLSMTAHSPMQSSNVNTSAIPNCSQNLVQHCEASSANFHTDDSFHPHSSTSAIGRTTTMCSQQGQNFSNQVNPSQPVQSFRNQHVDPSTQPVVQNYPSTQQTPGVPMTPTQYDIKQQSQTQQSFFSNPGIQNMNIGASALSSMQNVQGNSAATSNSMSNTYASSSINNDSNLTSSLGNCAMTGRNINHHGLSHSSTAQELPYGQSQTISSDFNSSNLDGQSQPKMLDLLSDSYSILLSDDFSSGKDVQNINVDPQNQQLTPLLPHSSYQGMQTDTNQNRAATSGSSLLMPQNALITGQPTPGHSFVQDASAVNTDRNELFNPEPGVKHPQANRTDTFNIDPNFQSSQVQGHPGIFQDPVVINQTGQSSTSIIPNFLVTTGSAEATLAHGMVSSPSIQNVTSETSPSPRNANGGGPFAGSSPLSPSIYLSGQAHRHSRTSWTNADLQPRGIPLPPMRPRAPPSSNPQGFNVRQRLFTPVTQARGRGYLRTPARGTTAPRGRALNPRMPRSNMREDDDVIVTAVTRIFPQMEQHQQHNQQLSGRQANQRGVGQTNTGRSQTIAMRNRGRGQVSRHGVPHPIPPSPHGPPRQFDISKHFEDLACVVNSSAEDEDPNRFIDDDIEIVSITPGKDKDKPNQPKAVDASKFSFCCVHCGKDQGSRKVMKQHMKARHNDSLLGAFTNIETGQLLFFCPQLTCEFMTYDERRLSEHLSKCFDLDKSKPFDFGTAIKNLKSLKIRQLDVRTVRGSESCPINLDGQGMKDNFSSSLNDAFDDIVVNTSGRQIVRPAAHVQQTYPSPARPSLPPPRGAIRGPVPVRNQPPRGAGSRMHYPNYPEAIRMSSQVQRPMFRPRIVNSGNTNFRPMTGVASNPRVRRRIVREMVQGGRGYPRTPSQPPRPQVPLNPIMPGVPAINASPLAASQGGSQQEPIVIDLDADSPEKPAEQSSVTVVQTPQVSGSSPPSLFSNAFSSLKTVSSTIPQDSYQSIPSINSVESTSHNIVTVSNESSQPNQNSVVYTMSVTNMAECVTTTSVLENLSNYVGSLPAETSLTSTSHSGTESLSSFHTCDTEVNQSDAVTNETLDSSLTSIPFSKTLMSTSDTADVGIATAQVCSMADTGHVSSLGTPSENTANTVSSESPTGTSSANSSQPSGTQSVPTATTSGASEAAEITHILDRPSALSSVPPVNDCINDEEKVNAVLLEKVFAKVPNMPKNLSRRLVAKFKQYANYRGVKITADSKVIDEFVSKIYYKGSSADKDSAKAAVVAASSQPSQPPDSSNTNQSASVAETVVDATSGQSEQTRRQEQYDSKEEQKTRESKSITAQHDTSTACEDRQQPEKGNKEPSGENPMPSSEVVATHAILAERNLHFSGPFADMVRKAVPTSQKSENHSAEGRTTAQQNQQPTLDLGCSIDANCPALSVAEADVHQQNDGLPGRSNSFSCDGSPKISSQLRRSSSYPLNLKEEVDVSETVMTINDLSTAAAVKVSFPSALLPSPRNIPASSVMQVVSEDDSSRIPNAVPVKASSCDGEICIPTIGSMLHENSPLIGKDVLMQPASTVSLPSITERDSDEVPVLFTSKVDDLVSGYPELEVDIAGIPCKEEPLDKEAEQLSAVSENLEDSSCKNHSQLLEKASEKVEKVTAVNAELMDKGTGKLMFKKKKGSKPREKLIKSDDDDDDDDEAVDDVDECKGGDKEVNTEEQFVRRSTRCRKLIHQEMDADANEIDELMSDDDEEYNMDDDEDDYDTDSDREVNDSGGQPPRKKIRKTKSAPDPTAFNVTTKGEFKCWLCKKVYHKCTTVKFHIIRKHSEGLCAFHLDRSIEINKVCLLLFCPRKCKYVTESLEGLRGHRETCTKPLLEDLGENYSEITSKFLATTYLELLNKDVQDILTIGQKKKDSSKSLKRLNEAPEKERSSVVIPHSDAVTSQSGNVTANSTVNPQISPQSRISLAGPSLDNQTQLLPTSSSSNDTAIHDATTILAKPVQGLFTGNLVSSAVSETSTPFNSNPAVFTSRINSLPSNSTSSVEMALTKSNSNGEARATASQTRSAIIAGGSRGEIKAAVNPTSGIGAVRKTITRPPFPTQHLHRPQHASHVNLPQRSFQANVQRGPVRESRPVVQQSAQHSYATSQLFSVSQTSAAMPPSSGKEEDMCYVIEENGTICLE